MKREIARVVIVSLAATAFSLLAIRLISISFDAHTGTETNSICRNVVGILNTLNSLEAKANGAEHLSTLMTERAREDIFPFKYSISLKQNYSEINSIKDGISYSPDFERIGLLSYTKRCADDNIVSKNNDIHVYVSRVTYSISDTFILFFKNSLIYIVIIALLFFLAVFVASKVGLQPLTKVSKLLEKRNNDDLSPIGVKPEYIEVAPLIDTVDNLLESIRNKIERERAFVNEAAHELKTPIAVIAIQAHVLKRAVDPGRRIEAAVNFDRAIDRANHLIEQLLALANLEGQNLVELTSLDVIPVIQNTLALLANQAIGKNIDLNFDSPDRLVFLTNEFLLISVIQNVVGNAVKYTPSGGHISVNAFYENKAFHIQVRDTGPGIPEKHRSSVFDKFYRVPSITNSEPGAGLGLSIVAVILKKLNGRAVISDAEPGCLFSISFEDSSTA